MVLQHLNAELAAALALGVAQLGSGLLLRLVSPSNISQQATLSHPSVVITSEILKLVISAGLYLKYGGSATSNEKNGDYNYELKDSDSASDGQEDPSNGLMKGVRSIRDAVSSEAIYGLAHVAAAYMVASGVSHPISSTNESGLCGLIRASVVMTTALMMVYMLRSRFSAGQLSAIILLMCGTAVLQFSTPKSVLTTFSQSSLLAFQTIILAGASVYNQKIYQCSEGSYHAMNMALFGFSAVLNTLLFAASHIGYGAQIAVSSFDISTLVIAVLANAVVGLTAAAVLKYHDALVMYFILSLSTGFLLCFEQFFTKSISLLAIPGAGVILLATYQYFLSTNASPAVPGSPLEPAKIQLTPTQTSKASRYLRTPIGVAVTSILAVLLSVPILHYQNATAATLAASGLSGVEMSFEEADVVAPQPSAKVVESPFKNTVAFIRINNYLPQREKLVRDAYAPYFHTVHVSMPDKGKHKVTDTTPERDYWNDGHLPYSPVRSLLNVLLEEEQAKEHDKAVSNATSTKGAIEGMLYFHFDGWIEPLGFHDMPMERLWALNSGGSLPYKCMRGTDYREPDWIWFVNGGIEKIKKANRVTKHLHSQYDIDEEEFCMGWSDLYYIPQRFFQDYITLTGSFGAIQVMHEVALPTIWRIIERTYSTHPSESVILRWGDCFGGCCQAVRFKDEILENRCGHKLDYLDWATTRVHYDRLEKNAQMLGKPWPEESLMAWENWLK